MPSREKIAANLIINGLLPQLKRAGISVADSPVTPLQIGALAALVDAGVRFSDAKMALRLLVSPIPD